MVNEFVAEGGSDVAITVKPGVGGVLQVFVDGDKIYDKVEEDNQTPSSEPSQRAQGGREEQTGLPGSRRRRLARYPKNEWKGPGTCVGAFAFGLRVMFVPNIFVLTIVTPAAGGPSRVRTRHPRRAPRPESRAAAGLDSPVFGPGTRRFQAFPVSPRSGPDALLLR